MDIKSRMAELGMKQVDMIMELRKRGIVVQPPMMSSVLRGVYTYAIHESKEFLQELLEDIIEIANELGITVNTRKTRICKLSEHWSEIPGRSLQDLYRYLSHGRK